MSNSTGNNTLPPYSHELAWPDGLEPYRIIDETGSQSEPYEHYRWMRQNAPVLRVRHEDSDVWMVSRFEDVRNALRKPKLFRSQVHEVQPLAFLTLMDNADHTRLRSVVAAAFTPKNISATEDLIREIAAERLDAMIDSRGGEVVENFARPLTMAMISSIVKIPIDDIDQVSFWADQMFTYFARIARNAPGLPYDEQHARDFFKYLNENLRRLYSEHSQSVGGNIARSWLDDGALTEQEATELCGFVFVSGFETTARLIAGAFRELHYNPSLLGRLRDEPDAPARFVEELVRMRGPVHRVVRRTTEDTEMQGITIPAGSTLRLLIASANRDESVWPRANEFDIDRKADGHFGFGYGIHTCLGAPLARLETLVTTQLLAQKVASVSFDHDRDIVYLKGNSMIVGPESLRVDLVPSK
jgi:cytochrome P450